ncbi:aconitase family protein, partial [Acinetobacter baumannii]
THNFLRLHGREKDYRALAAKDMAYYDGCVEVELSTIKPMIALPFHPANVYEIATLNENLADILREVEVESEKISLGRAKLSLLDKIE